MTKIKVQIIKKIFSKEDYAICSCEVLEDCQELNCLTGEIITVKGSINGAELYAPLDLYVSPVFSPKYGLQYQVDYTEYLTNVQEITPEQNYELLKLIANGKQPDHIQAAYPDFVQRILMGQQDSIDIKQIYNVGPTYFETYVEKIHKKFGYLYLRLKFPAYKILDSEYKVLTNVIKGGLTSIESQLSEHPYKVLIQYLHRSFKSVDKVVLSTLNEPYPFPLERCTYMVVDLLETYTQQGHTRIKNIDLAEMVLQQYPDMIDFLVETLDNTEVIWYDKEEGWVSLQRDFLIESQWATHIQNLNSTTSFSNSYHLDKYRRYGEYDVINLTDEQLKILQLAEENNICILTGAAGTGKSESINALVRMLNDSFLTFTLLAPTGIAAKRLEEATGHKAHTIHKYYIEFESIVTDYVIIDETSMLSLEHISILLSLLSTETKIVMIGDTAQLAAIGKGNILYDMVQSKLIPHAHLSHVFRYGQNSIYTVATDIRRQQNYFSSANLSDKHYEFRPVAVNFEAQIISVYNELLSCYNKRDILILSPFNKRNYGSIKLNEIIQHNFNPNPEVSFYGRNFKVGDLIINTKNAYGIDNSVFNGDRGVVRNIGFNDELQQTVMTVEFDNFLYEYTQDNWQNIQLSYSISAHKSQGSQAKAVILVTVAEHQRLLTNNLLYTAITRAQEKVIHIGEQSTIENALYKQETKNKNTWLQDFLQKKEV